MSCFCACCGCLFRGAGSLCLVGGATVLAYAGAALEVAGCSMAIHQRIPRVVERVFTLAREEQGDPLFPAEPAVALLGGATLIVGSLLCFAKAGDLIAKIRYLWNARIPRAHDE